MRPARQLDPRTREQLYRVAEQQLMRGWRQFYDDPTMGREIKMKMGPFEGMVQDMFAQMLDAAFRGVALKVPGTGAYTLPETVAQLTSNLAQSQTDITTLMAGYALFDSPTEIINDTGAPLRVSEILAGYYDAACSKVTERVAGLRR